jgi:nucleoside-diphosphate-sugar epimerase
MSNEDGKHVLITGGAGYVGSALVPSLLDKGYTVTVYDLYLYGDVFHHLQHHPNLLQVKADIRDKKRLVEAARHTDAILHLACISNDPSYELDPELGKSINYDAFSNVLEAAETNGVRRVIYASTSSVYGIKEERNVRENASCEPLTDYSKYKLECEHLLLDRESTDMERVVVRPATVCGYATRLRLDLVVNILTIHALINKKIKIFGGQQLRPNINIKDMIRVYETLLSVPADKINGEIFNAGYQNLTVQQIAELVRETIHDPSIMLEEIPTDDIRSYHINSEKIRDVLDFKPEYTIEDAVQSLSDAFARGWIKDGLHNPLYHNIKLMQRVKLN